jgi:hypothetical protein
MIGAITPSSNSAGHSPLSQAVETGVLTRIQSLRLVLFTDRLSAELLAHEDPVIAGFRAASRLFITD